MNFAQVRAVQGQMDGQWPAKITMLARFGEGTGVVGQTKAGKPQCKCTLTDDAGESQTVYLSGQDIPTPAMMGQRAEFKLNTFQGQGGTGYGGWWQSKTNVNQQPQGQAPAQNSYPPQQPAPPPSQPAPPAQRAATTAIDPTRISIERQCAWKAAGNVLKDRAYPNTADLISDMFKLAAAGAKFMADGKDIPTMGRQPGDDGPPPGDDDCPWDN